MDSSRNKRAPVERGAGKGNARSDGTNCITSATLHHALSRACAEVGIVDRDVPADGRWHPTDVNDDPRGRGDGRIKLFPDGEGGIVCNWKGETLPFFVDDGRKLTEAERRDRERKRAEAVGLAREEEARRHAEAATKAAAIWNAAQPATSDHPYLIRKRIQPHGARLYRGPLVLAGMPCDGSLIVPACNGSAVHTLQFIHPETRDGDSKRFLPGGDPRGRYFSIGSMDGAAMLCMCEGFATGASIHQATGLPVIVAFTAGNLEPVAKAMRKRFPELRVIVCGDDDAETPGNPGRTKAKEAARDIGARLAVPDFGEDRDPAWTDFNDLAVHRGPEVVAGCIRRQVESGAGEGAPETGPRNGAAPSDETGSSSSEQDGDGGDHATGDAEDLEATVHRLAELSPIRYDRVRQLEADALGVRVTTLDAEVVRARAVLNPGDDAALQGQAVAIDGPEPWPDEVDGAEAVNGTSETLSRHVALPDGAADVMALWITHSHCHLAFLHSPRLNITSPEKGCGKTLVLDVLHTLTPKAIRTESITTAVLFRLIDKHAPTLLVDEYDAFIHDNEELRGALNAGHKRGGVHLRCEGDKNEVRGFRTFAPVALAGIRDLPGTLVDRSIIIRMQRMGADERRKPFDERRTEPEKILCRKLARWARDNFHALEAADPEMPMGSGHRVRDNWRPLFAIADQVGGDWPDRVRKAFALLAKPDDAARSRSEMLLGDFRALFAKHGDWIMSAAAVGYLVEMEDRPWPEYSRGKPITARQVAAALRRFEIKPVLARVGTVGRGYVKDHFIDAFKRYLPPEDLPSDPLHRYNVGGARLSEDLNPLQTEGNVTDRKSPQAKQDAGCNDVTDREPPPWGTRL